MTDPSMPLEEAHTIRDRAFVAHIQFAQGEIGQLDEQIKGLTERRAHMQREIDVMITAHGAIFRPQLVDDQNDDESEIETPDSSG